jgi:hypothetical protein
MCLLHADLMREDYKFQRSYLFTLKHIGLPRLDQFNIFQALERFDLKETQFEY